MKSDKKYRNISHQLEYNNNNSNTNDNNWNTNNVK